MKPSSYRDLILSYLHDMYSDAEEFSKIFDRAYLTDPENKDDELFSILEGFWEAVEVYSPSWEPSEINELHITEETLRSEAKNTLRKLDKYIQEHPE